MNQLCCKRHHGIATTPRFRHVTAELPGWRAQQQRRWQAAATVSSTPTTANFCSSPFCIHAFVTRFFPTFSTQSEIISSLRPPSTISTTIKAPGSNLVPQTHAPSPCCCTSPRQRYERNVAINLLLPFPLQLPPHTRPLLIPPALPPHCLHPPAEIRARCAAKQPRSVHVLSPSRRISSGTQRGPVAGAVLELPDDLSPSRLQFIAPPFPTNGTLSIPQPPLNLALSPRLSLPSRYSPWPSGSHSNHHSLKTATSAVLQLSPAYEATALHHTKIVTFEQAQGQGECFLKDSKEGATGSKSGVSQEGEQNQQQQNSIPQPPLKFGFKGMPSTFSPTNSP